MGADRRRGVRRLHARNRGAAQRPRRPSRRPFVTLGGASKTLGLPQVKLGWMIAGGPPDERRASAARPRARCRRVPVGEHTRSGCGVTGFAGSGAAVRGAIHNAFARTSIGRVSSRVDIRRVTSCASKAAGLRQCAFRHAPGRHLVLDLLAAERARPPRVLLRLSSRSLRRCQFAAGTGRFCRRVRAQSPIHELRMDNGEGRRHSHCSGRCRPL